MLFMRPSFRLLKRFGKKKKSEIKNLEKQLQMKLQIKLCSFA